MSIYFSLEDRFIESNFLETDEELGVSETLLLETDPAASTDDFDLFADSESQASPLYSVSADTNTEDEEQSLDNAEDEEQPLDNNLDLDLATEEDILTQTVTVGNPEGTQFTFNFSEDTPQEVIEGVKQAAENWSSVLKDNVNININFTFNPDEEGSGLLGFNISEYIPLSYANVSEALAEDVTSTNDETAIANLTEDNLDILINNTSENNGSDTPYLDDNGGFNNSNVLITRANAKALGIGLEDLAEEFGVSVEELAQGLNVLYPEFFIDPNAPDATMNFSSNVNWDFDPSDGIASDAYDFVGVVTHEIGHALGFESSADTLDLVADSDLDLADIIDSIDSPEIQELIANTGAQVFANAVAIDQFISENEYLLTPLDFFRYTQESHERGAVDFTAGNINDKYFSLDGGQTELAPLSEGTQTGDLQQLSHWEDNLNIGIMDPTGDLGESLEITEEDLIAFDAIGWDLA